MENYLYFVKIQIYSICKVLSCYYKSESYRDQVNSLGSFYNYIIQ